MSELKPCPFSGAKPYFKSEVKICCDESNIVMVGVQGKEELARVWNTRAAPKVKTLEWREGAGYYRTSGILGENYEIVETSKGFHLCLDRDDQCTDLIGNYATLEDAKSGAQSYYENQILEALE